MWYLILPPIVILAALSILVYFFSRRFPQIERERLARVDEAPETIVRNVPKTAKKVSLRFLERLARRFKIIILRAHTMLDRRAASLREKKEARSATITPVISPEESAEIRPMISRRAAHPEVSPFSRSTKSRRETLDEEREQPQEVIGEEVLMQEQKGQFEDILVERIAANPRDLEAYERLGEYYMEQGNVQDAKECYRQVIRLSPVHRLAKIKIRRLEKMLEQK
jgi:tetratricopeptide (TPR) repeat protein